jgi:hypothetical protein
MLIEDLKNLNTLETITNPDIEKIEEVFYVLGSNLQSEGKVSLSEIVILLADLMRNKFIAPIKEKPKSLLKEIEDLRFKIDDL